MDRSVNLKKPADAAHMSSQSKMQKKVQYSPPYLVVDERGAPVAPPLPPPSFVVCSLPLPDSLPLILALKSSAGFFTL